MIPAAWKEKTRAPRGKILVQHKSMESIRHGIYLPPNYLRHTRTAAGIVKDIHPDCGETMFKVGDAVLLSATGGTMLVFGLYQSEESELWVYSPRSVRIVFEPDASEEVEDHGEHIHRYAKSLEARMPTVDDRFVEGDPKGLR